MFNLGDAVEYFGVSQGRWIPAKARGRGWVEGLGVRFHQDGCDAEKKKHTTGPFKWLFKRGLSFWLVFLKVWLMFFFNMIFLVHFLEIVAKYKRF